MPDDDPMFDLVRDDVSDAALPRETRTYTRWAPVSERGADT
jgi:hypothetical protein